MQLKNIWGLKKIFGVNVGGHFLLPLGAVDAVGSWPFQGAFKQGEGKQKFLQDDVPT